MIFEDTDCILFKNDGTIKIGDPLKIYKVHDVIYDVYNTKRKQAKWKKNSRDSGSTADGSQIAWLEEKALRFLQKCRSSNLFKTDKPMNQDEIDIIKQENINFMNDFYQNTAQVKYSDFHGENTLSSGVEIMLEDEKYLIPEHCRFINKNIEYISNYLPFDENTFDFIVMDPPWTNRYIKRIKKSSNQQSYFTLDDTEIQRIPIENYIKHNSIVTIWSTNSEAHISSIKNQFLVKWNLKLIACWYWVKVDRTGETICAFGEPGNKQPYELLFIATHKDNEDLINKIPDKRILCSIPSSIHSQKPQLFDLFKNLLPETPKCLEIFARSLQANFTSIGLEVLRLQNARIFKE